MEKARELIRRKNTHVCIGFQKKFNLGFKMFFFRSVIISSLTKKYM